MAPAISITDIVGTLLMWGHGVIPARMWPKSLPDAVTRVRRVLIAALRGDCPISPVMSSPLKVPHSLLTRADEVIELRAMSAFGTKRTSPSAQLMSAFGGKADIANSPRHVRL
jgi:hypothetical protein